jgi:hypothetical protein
MAKLLVAAFTIASAVGLTGMGTQALASTAVPHAAPAATSAGDSHGYTTAASTTVARPAASPDFTCPSTSVCLFQGSGLNGAWCVFSMPGDGDQWYDLRSACDFTIPWGSLNDNTGSRVVFKDDQTGAEYCEPAGYRGTPSSAVRNTGYMYIQYGVTSC